MATSSRKRGRNRRSEAHEVPRGGRRLRQRLTVANSENDTEHVLVIDRFTGRLSWRQYRETFRALVPPGFRPAGVLGEWPLRQTPPEYPGVEYVVVEMGEGDKYHSNLYMVPAATAEAMVEHQGARYPTDPVEDEPRRAAAG